MHYATRLGACILAGGLIAIGPARGLAQEVYETDREQNEAISARGYAGVAVPSGRLNRITSVGPSFGGSLAWHFHPYVALRGDVQWSRLDDASDEFGNIFVPLHLLYFGGALEVDFAPPSFQHEPMTFSVSVGAGATNIQADENFNFPADPEALAFDQTYFTVTGSAEIGYQIGDNVAFVARGQPHLMLTDAEDVVPLLAGSPEAEAFDSAWYFPLTLGIALLLP